MDMPSRQVSWLERFPPDIWAYIVCYLPGEQLLRLTNTGATLLRQRLKSPTVVKSIKLGKSLPSFKSFPMFLSDLPSLEELSIHSHHHDWSGKIGITIDLLPSGVKKLEFSGDWRFGDNELFGENGATFKLNEHLPQLEILSFGDVMFASNYWLKYSPQSLTKLSLQRWNGRLALPCSLMHFEVCDVAISPFLRVSNLPPGLKSFIVQDELRGVEVLIPLLPPSTHKLSLGKHLNYYVQPMTPQKLVEQLPRSLIWLAVPSSICGVKFKWNAELTSLLPSTLTTLKLKTDLPCSAWPFLPQQLSNLSFRAPSTLGSKITDIDEVEHEVTSIPFGSLPMSITKLKLSNYTTFCSPPSASNQSFLPPQLTYLSMRMVQLSPESAQLLPSSLTYLEVGSLCERAGQNLPTGLKTLKYDATVDPEFFDVE